MTTFRDVAPQDASATMGESKVFFFRRGAGEFALAFANAVSKLQVKEILSVTQSESDGNISLTMIYR